MLNRPDEGNLITNEMGMEIARMLRDIGPEIKLVRLPGRGANFCKGRQAPQIDRETIDRRCRCAIRWPKCRSRSTAR